MLNKTSNQFLDDVGNPKIARTALRMVLLGCFSFSPKARQFTKAVPTRVTEGVDFRDGPKGLQGCRPLETQ